MSTDEKQPTSSTKLPPLDACACATCVCPNKVFVAKLGAVCGSCKRDAHKGAPRPR